MSYGDEAALYSRGATESSSSSSALEFELGRVGQPALGKELDARTVLFSFGAFSTRWQPGGCRSKGILQPPSSMRFSTVPRLLRCG